MIKIAADDAPTILAKTSFTSACLVAVIDFVLFRFNSNKSENKTKSNAILLV
jgi:hypothetical protein